MKKVLVIGLSAFFCIILSLSAFALGDGFTQLDLIPLDSARLQEMYGASWPVVWSSNSVSVAQNGLSASASIPPSYLVQYRKYRFGMFGEGDYLFRAQGMSLYELTIDCFFRRGLLGNPEPIPGDVRCRFLDLNGDAASSFVDTWAVSNDGLTRTFRFVLRETDNLDIYGVDIEFTSPNISSVDSVMMTFSNFGWKVSTGTDTVQEAILSGVDVLVYGSTSLQRLNELGFETFDQFVETEEFYWQYVHEGFAYFGIDDLWPNGSSFVSPMEAYQNDLLFINYMYDELFYNLNALPGILKTAIAVGVLSLLLGAVGIVISKAKKE